MRPIPYDIKIEVFRSYLEGHSIPQISNLYNVSVGAVSSIIKEETNKDENFQFLREITKIIKKNQLNPNDLISAIHLNSMMETLGLSTGFIEKFFDSSNTKSFRLDMNLDEFLNKINDIIDFEKSNQIKIHDIPPLIEKMKNQLEELRREKEMIEKEIINSCGETGVVKSQILEYIKHKPLIVEYQKKTDTFYKSLDWNTYPALFEKASKQLGRDIDPNVLYKKLLSIYTKPHENSELIRTILDIIKIL